MERTETDLLRLWIARDRAGWVKSTYITEDTEAIEAAASEAVMAATARAAAAAARYADLELPETLRRKFRLLKLGVALPPPADPAQRAELAHTASQLEGIYGRGRYCPGAGAAPCLTLDDLVEKLRESRDADELLRLWRGWHEIAPPMRPLYERYVRLANQGAREFGFADVGAMWRSRYDMPPAAFEAEVDRLWSQVEPLYRELHCYARARLRAFYGPDRVPADGPLPAHLLGNMWAQEWGGIVDLLRPQARPTRAARAAARAKAGPSPLERALARRKIDAVGMTRIAERFFTSLGLEPLPESFWRRSMFTRPRDRDVVCHASAWDIDADTDLRIKMCIRPTDDDFSTIHHELGHNYYYLYYRHLPPLFRDSAHDGFHEGLGDTLALSVTPAYLDRIGLVPLAPAAPGDDVGYLLERALDRVAFLPFGILVDKWRWEVFDGRAPPASWNARWWELRRAYQGVAPAAPRGEADFDPGAKYHVPANVPYARYFLASILQYQFHRALCRVAGHTGPLHTCSIYGSREAGARLRAMMELGISRPWPEALAALTGERTMDASAILDYYAPLRAWLGEQNRGQRCGW